MKKIILLAVVVVTTVSCLKNSKDAIKSSLAENFENYSVTFREDSTFYFPNDYLGIGRDFIVFAHDVNLDGEFRGGFRLSKLEGLIKESKDEDAAQTVADNTLDLTWRVHSAPMQNTYAVFASGGSLSAHIAFLYPTYGTCSPKCCYVCNTAKVAQEIAKKFERGDKFTLTAKGYLNDKLTNSASIDLADYTLVDKNGAPKDSIMHNWTMFDLSALGSIDKVRFEMNSGNKDLPHSFCLDVFMADIHLEY